MALPSVRGSGRAAAVLLAAVALLHALWALGSVWPLADRARFAEVVVGTTPDRLPTPGMTWVVAGLCALAAALLALRAQGRGGRLPAWGSGGVGAVMALRGAGGLAVSGWLRLGPGAFRFWDLRLYSPLCLLLAFLCLRTAAGRD